MGEPPQSRSRPWPRRLEFRRATRTLHVDFDDGAHFEIPFELLRVESPSAEVQGHGPSSKVLVRSKQTIGIVRADPVGRYAVRIVFDDGHDTGLFSWDWLYRLGRDRDALLADYRAKIASG